MTPGGLTPAQLRENLAKERELSRALWNLLDQAGLRTWAEKELAAKVKLKFR